MSREIEHKDETSRERLRKAKLSIEVADAIEEHALRKKEKPFFDFKHDENNSTIRIYRIIKRLEFTDGQLEKPFYRKFIGTLPDFITSLRDLDHETLARLWSINPTLPAYLANWLSLVHAPNFAYKETLTCLARLERELSLFAATCSDEEKFELIRVWFIDDPDLPKRLAGLWQVCTDHLRDEGLTSDS